MTVQIHTYLFQRTMIYTFSQINSHGFEQRLKRICGTGSGDRASQVLCDIMERLKKGVREKLDDPPED